VVVLESRKRIGGRVFSHQITSNHTIELGAEWVGASHERVIALCEQFKLKLLNNQFDSHLLYKGKYSPKGQWGYSATWEQKLEKILKDFKQLSDADQRKLDQYDWWRFLVNNGCAGQDLDLRELLDSTDFGESIRHVSAYSALAEYSESSPKNEMDYKILGGNSRLAEKLVEQIGMSHILLDHTVQHIEQADKVKVTCMNGEVFEADKLVCSLPTFAMKQIQWSPALPEAKMDAINELQYARINKHALVFSDRFWKDEAFDLVTDACPHYFYHATKNQPGPEGVLIGYTIGEKAAVFANRTQEANATDVNNTLKPLFGDILSKLQAQSNYYWGGDPYSQGAYALYGVNQWFRIRPVLAMPFLHTHFAGEHIADWQGFMEGAIVTGEDAADQIIS
jgi:monoamine oxidase